MTTGRIRLIHWNAAEAQEKISRLQGAGYEVDFEPFTPDLLRQLVKDLPAAVVIDLSRLPSQGRDVAVRLRIQKPTRQVPILFVGGDPEKTERIRKLLPDAFYGSWDQAELRH